MDREIWRSVLHAVRHAAAKVHDGGRCPVYPNWLIVAMYLWSVCHDRCLSWACDRSHYGGVFRPRGALPSISQFTRRTKTDSFQRILQLTHEQLMRDDLISDSGYFDGKALTVGPFSRDRDAARGRVGGGFAKGYKLHVYVTRRRRICVWSVMPLNVAEQSVALQLCDHLPAVARTWQPQLTLADSNYDSAPLHKRLAAEDRLLLTPLKAQQRVHPMRGHHPVTLRQMGPARRAALAVWKHYSDLARYVLKERNNVEGTLSVLAVALGLDHLPPWVRTLPRVRRWVGGKIILYHARLAVHNRATSLEN